VYPFCYIRLIYQAAVNHQLRRRRKRSLFPRRLWVRQTQKALARAQEKARLESSCGSRVPGRRSGSQRHNGHQIAMSATWASPARTHSRKATQECRQSIGNIREREIRKGGVVSAPRGERTTLPERSDRVEIVWHDQESPRTETSNDRIKEPGSGRANEGLRAD